MTEMHPNELVLLLTQKTREGKIQWERTGGNGYYGSDDVKYATAVIDGMQLKLTDTVDKGDRFHGPTSIYTLTVTDNPNGVGTNNAQIRAENGLLIGLWSAIVDVPKDNLLGRMAEALQEL